MSVLIIKTGFSLQLRNLLRLSKIRENNFIGQFYSNIFNFWPRIKQNHLQKSVIFKCSSPSFNGVGENIGFWSHCRHYFTRSSSRSTRRAEAEAERKLERGFLVKKNGRKVHGSTTHTKTKS